MINSDGTLISSFSEIPADLIQKLHSEFRITEKLRYQKGKILFWEQHYFRMIASLRRHRFQIPITYTMEYLQAEIDKLMGAETSTSNNALIHFQFLPYQDTIAFLMSIAQVAALDQTEPSQNYDLDLFKEASVQASNLSNLSTTNKTVFTIGKRYAEENGLDDCILLNDQKNLVETLQGSLYLFQENKILTPNLESGCQDFTFRTAFNEWLLKGTAGLELLEQPINPFELQKSKELLVLSIEYGGQSITQYRKTSYNSVQSQKVYRTFIDQLD